MCPTKERRSSTSVALPPNVLNIVHEEDSFGSVRDKQITILDDDIKGKVAKKSPEIESSEVKDSATLKSDPAVESQEVENGATLKSGPEVNYSEV